MVLDSGFEAWDSGFLKLYYIAKDSGFHNKFFQDSGFHKPKFPGFRNPNSLTWGDNNVILKNGNSKIYCVSIELFFFFLFFFNLRHFFFFFSLWVWKRILIKLKQRKI